MVRQFTFFLLDHPVNIIIVCVLQLLQTLRELADLVAQNGIQLLASLDRYGKIFRSCNVSLNTCFPFCDLFLYRGYLAFRLREQYWSSERRVN